MGAINNVLKIVSSTKTCLIMSLQNFDLTNLILEKWSMANKKRRYLQSYSLWNEIHTNNSGLWQMGSQKKWHFR